MADGGADGGSAEAPGPSPRGLRRPIAIIVAIWLGWAVCLFGFQELVLGRYAPNRPDHVLEWTANETGLRSHARQPYLLDSTFRGHVAWDSEFYLSIAVGGYPDPAVATMRPERGGPPLSLNHAFMPFYPAVIRVIATPFWVLGTPPLPTAILVGLGVSLASTLAAMLALFHLARRRLGDDGGLRAAVYLLVFPTGFFLAQVYSEALFLALSIGALAALADRRPLIAAVLAVLAVWTRPVGLALVLPAVLAAVVEWRSWRGADAPRPDARRLLRWLVPIAAPLLAYLAWWISPLGRAFGIVQDEYFGRALFDWEGSIAGWARVFERWKVALPETRIYFALELAAVGLALVSSLWALRRWPGVGLFGLGVLAVALTSGSPQSLIRYVLAVPAIFLLAATLGRSAVFDRIWTIANVLLLGLLTTLFTFDLWVA